MKKFLKNLRNSWSEFGIISQDCLLCDAFQKLFAKFWSIEKHGHRVGEAFCTVWNSEKCFKILLLLHHLQLKINSSWPELFNFQNSFNCHWLELLRTAPLPIHKVIIIAIFQDGMNGIYLYSVNKHRSSWLLLGLYMKIYTNMKTRFTCLERIVYCNFVWKKNLGECLSKSIEVVVEMRKGPLTKFPN